MTRPNDDGTALVLMDLQRGILETHADSTFLERIRQTVDAARQAGLPVIWVKVAFRSGYPEVSPRNKSFSALRQARRLVEGDPQTDFHPELRPEPGDVIVTKRRISAFSGSDLDTVLRAAGIDTLVLAGVATSGVVLSTVSLAADLDYRITVLQDGCADSDPEVHRVLTEKVFPRQATVRTISDWVGALQR